MLVNHERRLLNKAAQSTDGRISVKRFHYRLLQAVHEAQQIHHAASLVLGERLCWKDVDATSLIISLQLV